MSDQKLAMFTCRDCGADAMEGYDGDDMPSYGALNHLCRSCARSYPESLLKSVVDAFDYALALRDGTVIRFESASLDGRFVHLNYVREIDHVDLKDIDGYTFDRGIDVRIGDILWCCDAPRGS